MARVRENKLETWEAPDRENLKYAELWRAVV